MPLAASFLSLMLTTPFDAFLQQLVAFITGPFGKSISLIAFVFCGAAYMLSKQADNSNIGRVAIGALLIIFATNIFAWIAGSN